MPNPGYMTMQAAAAVPTRIGAGASFHGGGLVTDKPDSPHLLVPRIKARYYIGVAAHDDEREPGAKVSLQRHFAQRNWRRRSRCMTARCTAGASRTCLARAASPSIRNRKRSRPGVNCSHCSSWRGPDPALSQFPEPILLAGARRNADGRSRPRSRRSPLPHRFSVSGQSPLQNEGARKAVAVRVSATARSHRPIPLMSSLVRLRQMATLALCP